MNRRLILSVLCVSSVGLHLWGAETPTTNTAGGTAAPTAAASNAPASNAPVATAEDLKQLREKIAQQEEEIKRLQKSIEDQQKILERSMQNAAAAQPAGNSTATADGTPVVATKSAPDQNAPVQLVPAVNVPRPRVAFGRNAWQHPEAAPSALSVSIGNTTFTPLGFVDATFFARSTNVGSGIGTNFAGIPYSTAAAGHLSETSFSAQNSRFGIRIDSNFVGAKILGYLETDFLFNNDANSFQITSNSAGLRLRNYFVDMQKGSFEIMGGQDWSFLTPNRKGLSPLPADIFYTQNMDTNYQLGLTWTRAPQFRFIGHFSEDFALGVALENPQQYIGGGSGASTVTLPNNLSASLQPQFQYSPGLNVANTITNIPNLFPDVIFKGAYDAHAGDKIDHIEAAAVVRGFKDYVTSTTAPAIQGSHTAVGYAGAINGNFEIIKNVHLIANTYFGQGGGRYIFGVAPDVIVRPDGSISPLHSYSTVDGVEAQVSKNTLLAMYYGGAYIGKNITFDPTASGSTLAKPVYAGYGTPGSTVTRDVQEITFDWVQTLWKNPNYGALSLINQYSYIWKEPWYFSSTTPRQAHSNIIYVDLRYTLP